MNTLSIAHRLFLIWLLYTFPCCAKVLLVSPVLLNFWALAHALHKVVSSHCPYLIGLFLLVFRTFVKCYLFQESFLIPSVLVKCSSFVPSCMVLSCVAVVFVLYKIYLVYYLEWELLGAEMIFSISFLQGCSATILN